MPDNFGLKIGVEGEKEFKETLRDINQTFKVLGSEMNLVSAQFDKQDKSVEAVAARNQVLNKEIDAQKEKISTLRDALENATNSFGENDKRTQAWAIQLNNAQAGLIGMERELDRNNKALDDATTGFDGAERGAGEFGRAIGDAGKELGDTGKETKNLGSEMDETGKKTSVFGDVLKASLAADAIKAGLSAIVDAVKAIGSAVKDYISESSQLATEATQSQTLLTQVMQNTMDASDAEIQNILKLAKAQEQLGVVSGTAQVTALAELASFVERKEALEDMLPVMNDYVAYQYGATASADQARNVATALGKAIQGNIDGLAKQGFQLSQEEKEWFKTATEAERVAFVMDMVSESMGGVNEALAQTDAGKMANLKTVMDNTKIAVGAMANEFKAGIMGQMLPAISSLSGAFLGVLHGDGSVEDMAAAFTGVFDEIADIIDKKLPVLLELGGNIITAVVGGIAGNMEPIIVGALSIINMFSGSLLALLPVILDAGTKLLFGMIDGFIASLPAIVDAAIQLVFSLADGLGGALPELIPAVVRAVVLIAETLLSNMDKILEAALNIILGLTEGLLAAIPELVDALPAIIDAIVAFVVGAVPQLVDAGFKLLTSLIGALPSIITSIVAAIPQIIESVVKAVIDSVPQLIAAGITLLVALIQALPEIITTIIAAMPLIITAIIETLSGDIDKIILTGVKLLVSLIENLPAIIFEIVKAVPLIITAIIDAFTGHFGEIVNVGTDLIKGLWQGISDAGDWLWDKISGFFGDVVGRIKDFFGIRSPSALFAEIGGDMGEGIGVGFERAMEQVGRDMRDAVPTDFDVNANITASGAQSGRGGAIQIVMHNVFNNYKPEDGAALVRDLNRQLGRIYA